MLRVPAISWRFVVRFSINLTTTSALDGCSRGRMNPKRIPKVFTSTLLLGSTSIGDPQPGQVRGLNETRALAFLACLLRDRRCFCFTLFRSAKIDNILYPHGQARSCTIGASELFVSMAFYLRHPCDSIQPRARCSPIIASRHSRHGFRRLRTCSRSIIISNISSLLIPSSIDSSLSPPAKMII